MVQLAQSSPTLTKHKGLKLNIKLYHVLLSLFVLHILHPALENGTDRGFRNVGKPQSDAGEIPKRIHTKIVS